MLNFLLLFPETIRYANSFIVWQLGMKNAEPDLWAFNEVGMGGRGLREGLSL